MGPAIFARRVAESLNSNGCNLPPGPSISRLAFPPARPGKAKFAVRRQIWADSSSPASMTPWAPTPRHNGTQVLPSLNALPDADNLRFDPETKLAWLGYGEGALGIIDPAATDSSWSAFVGSGGGAGWRRSVSLALPCPCSSGVRPVVRLSSVLVSPGDSRSFSRGCLQAAGNAAARRVRTPQLHSLQEPCICASSKA